MSRHDRGDDLMDRGAVHCLQLANEAKFDMYSPACEWAVGLLVQFQQRTARQAADGCDAGMTADVEEEDVKEMVAVEAGSDSTERPDAAEESRHCRR